MSNQLFHRLALLDPAEQRDLLRHCRHGIEKESLRVDPAGQLALTPHPRALGSALTHPQIIHRLVPSAKAAILRDEPASSESTTTGASPAIFRKMPA